MEPILKAGRSVPYRQFGLIKAAQKKKIQYERELAMLRVQKKGKT